MSDVTRILAQMESGDPTAAGQLLPLVYEELRRLAAAKLSRESQEQTLSATALVHEAYLRLVGDVAFTDRRHFFCVAAEAMRRILIERAADHEPGTVAGINGCLCPMRWNQRPARSITSFSRWMQLWNGFPRRIQRRPNW